jgi:hypothetical protein
MEELHWTEEQKQLAQDAVMERFAFNSVAKQFIPEETVGWTETTVRWNRYDFQRRMVIDRETLSPLRLIVIQYPITRKNEVQRCIRCQLLHKHQSLAT